MNASCTGNLGGPPPKRGVLKTTGGDDPHLQHQPQRPPRTRRRATFGGFAVRRPSAIFKKFSSGSRRRAAKKGIADAAGGCGLLDELDRSHRSSGASARSLLAKSGAASGILATEEEDADDTDATVCCHSSFHSSFDSEDRQQQTTSPQLDPDESLRSGTTQTTLDESYSLHSAPPAVLRCCSTLSSTLERTASHLFSSHREPPSGVTFGTVEIREYPCVLGDNPAVTCGPPLSIDWAYDPSATFVEDVDTYEGYRTGSPPRQKLEMLVPRSVREEWLMDVGYSRRDIQDAVREVDKVREGRRRSLHQGALLHRALAVKMLSKRARGRPDFRED